MREFNKSPIIEYTGMAPMNNRSHFKSTFKHAIIYSGANILAKVAGFIMLPIYAHYLRGVGYGILGMIDIILSVFVTLVGYGIGEAMRRFYFEKPSYQERNSFVSTTLIVTFFIVIVICLPSLFFSSSIAKIALGDSKYSFYIALAIWSFLFDMTGKTAESYILIQQRSLLISFLGLFRLALGLFFNIYFIVFLSMGVLGFLLSGLICAIIFSIIQHLYVFHNVGFHFDHSDVKKILAFSVPLVPGYVAMFIKNNANKVILRSSMGLVELGAFEMSFKFTTVIGMVLIEPFFKIWSVKRFEICDMPDGPDLMARMFTLLLAVLLLFGLVLSLEIPIVLRILTPQEFWVSSEVVFSLVLSRQLFACCNYFAFGLLYSKKTHLMSAVQFIAMGINLVSSLILIKPLGITGAAIVACFTYLFQSVITFIIAQKYYYIPFEWPKIFKMAVLAALLLLMIEQISVDKLRINVWLNKNLAPVLGSVMHLFHLDMIKGGELVAYAVKNTPLLFEGFVKFMLSMSFLLGLPMLGIIPKRIFRQLWSFKTLANPSRLFSDIL